MRRLTGRIVGVAMACLASALGLSPASADAAWRILDASKASADAAYGADAVHALAETGGVTARISIDAAIFDLPVGDVLEAGLPDGRTLTTRIVATELGGGGSNILRAAIEGGGEMILVESNGWASGRIETRTGPWRVFAGADKGVYLSPEPDPLACGVDHAKDAPQLGFSTPEAWFSRTPNTGPLDVMILYTPQVATVHGANLAARLDSYIADFNQALDRSGAPLRARLVHSQQVQYVDRHPKLSEILSDLGAGRVNERGDLSSIAQLRQQKGADIVYMITTRPESSVTVDSCGLASLSRPGSLSHGVGYDTTIEGVNFCGPRVFVHEAGHNLGACHDRDESCATGVNNRWSRGHFSSAMRTQMTYNGGSAFYNIYSTPTADCGGEPCGIPPGQTNEADTSTDLKIYMSGYARNVDQAQSAATAVAPAARVLDDGEKASFFGVVLNGGATDFQNCRPVLTGVRPGAMSFIETDPASNRPIGAPDRPFVTPAGGRATFRLDVQAGRSGVSRHVLQIACDNAAPAPVALDLNTITLSTPGAGAATADAGRAKRSSPDVVISAATLSSDGIARLSAATGGRRQGVFTAAARNLGDPGRVVFGLESPMDGVATTLCRVNDKGACLSPPRPQLDLVLAKGEQVLLTAFVSVHDEGPDRAYDGGPGGAPIEMSAFDPLTQRISVRARSPDGMIVGAASVAVMRGGR
ncbi:hypothetical protein GC169_04180 [bacterium]|nr:hypothetical protein [bacterium]